MVKVEIQTSQPPLESVLEGVVSALTSFLPKGGLEKPWAVVATPPENHHVIIIKGGESPKDLLISVHVRPEFPEKGKRDLIGYLKDLGSTKERDFWGIDPEALPSFPRGLCIAASQIPGFSFSLRCESTVPLAVIEHPEDPEALAILSQIIPLLQNRQAKIYDLSSGQVLKNQ